MLKPSTLSNGDIMAMDRAYIDYQKFEQMTQRGVIYVTKMKKNLRYSILSDTFYGESENAIKIQVWVTLIANLLLMILQKGLTRSWSFSGLATMVKITLMYYVDFYSLFNHPEKDWESIIEAAAEITSPTVTVRLKGLGNTKKKYCCPVKIIKRLYIY